MNPRGASDHFHRAGRRFKSSKGDRCDKLATKPRTEGGTAGASWQGYLPDGLPSPSVSGLKAVTAPRNCRPGGRPAAGVPAGQTTHDRDSTTEASTDV